MRKKQVLSARTGHVWAKAGISAGLGRMAQFLALTLACASAARAEPETNRPQTSASSAFKQDILWASAQTNRLRIGAYLDYVYIGPGTVDYAGANDRRSDAQSVNLAVAAEFPVTARWFVPLGLGSENIFLEPVEGVPIPDRINTVRFSAGLGYRFAEQWTVAASVGPAFYRVENIAGDDVGVGGMVRATCRVDPDLSLSFGLAFNPDSDVPVLPAFGARWNLRTNVTLNLMFPKPGVIYRVAPRLNLFAGAGLSGATFRTDDAFGAGIGQPRFNRQLATYWDIRAGVGADYELTRVLALSLEAGCSAWRVLNYKDLDETVRFGPAPFVQGGIRARF